MLSDTDQAILALEKRRYVHGGAKVQAIHAELDITPTTYFRRLAQLLNDPAAMSAEPLLVTRLRRLRAQRLAPRRAG